MILPPDNYRKDIAPYRVFFTWDLTYKCNYKCTYCAYGGAKNACEPEPTIYPGSNKIIESWENIFYKYKSCHIHIAGGEPFIYPEIFDILEKISEIHTWECSTNFFFEPEEIINRIEPDRARIGVSFHPEFVDFENFLSKAVKLKSAGFEIWANYVAYPLHMEKMGFYKEKFAEFGIIMSILPFKGEYNDIEYPNGYNENEKELLRSLGIEPWIEKTTEFFLNSEKQYNKKKLCRMGQMYAKIRSNGDVYICCSKNSKKLGNLYQGNVILLDEPFVCQENNCPCWRCMTIDNEEYWAPHWVVPKAARFFGNKYYK